MVLTYHYVVSPLLSFTCPLYPFEFMCYLFEMVKFVGDKKNEFKAQGREREGEKVGL